ncbi:MAG: hypothetical protein JXA11_04595 [Phycisphaerae bacterium]|nr:hypothetical protein [Phycisphaerae bacterium]
MCPPISRPRFPDFPIDAAYAGYMEKQAQAVAQMLDLDDKKIPPDFDYHAVTQLRYEAR